MFYKFKSIFLSSILIISACGGGGGGGDSENYNVESVNPISGTAVKGIIINGIVNIYGVTGGKKDTTVSLATGTTDENGNYDLEIENYVGPIFVEVTADPNVSKMICDIRPSCDEIPFGEEVDLDNNFKIKAVVGKLELDTPVTTNINTLTSLIAMSVEEKNRVNLSEVNNANSEVAELFGLEGKLSEMSVIDITNPENLVNASEDDLYMSVMNSAIAANAMNDGSELTEGLNNLFSDFAVSGGFLNNGEDTDVSVESIFTSASEIFESDEFSNIEAGGLKAKISIKKVQASMMAPGSKSVSMPTEQPKENSIEEAKTLIDNIRYFLLSTSYEESNEFEVMEDIGSALDFTNSYELDEHIEALALATEGFASLYSEFINNADVKRGESYEYDALTIEVTNSTENGDLELKIDEMYYNIDLNLSAKFSGLTNTSNFDYICSFQGESSKDQLHKETSHASFTLSGDMKGNDLVANVSKGDVSAKYNCNYLMSEAGNTESHIYDDYIDVSLDLDVEIAETTKNPLIFTGKFLYGSEFSASYKYENTADSDQLNINDPIADLDYPNTESYYSEDYSDSDYSYNDSYHSENYTDLDYPSDDYSVSDYSEDYSVSDYSEDYSDSDYSDDDSYHSENYTDLDYPSDDYSVSDYSDDDLYHSEDYSDSDYSDDDLYHSEDYSDSDYSDDDSYHSENYTDLDYPSDDYSDSDYSGDDLYYSEDYNDSDYPYDYEAQSGEDIQAYTRKATVTLSGEFKTNNNKMKLSISASLEDSDYEEKLWANNENLKQRTNLNSNNSEKISVFDIVDSLYYPDAIEIDTDELIESPISMSIDLEFDTYNSNDITGISITSSNAVYGEDRTYELEVALGNRKLIIDLMPGTDDTNLIISNQNGTKFELSKECNHKENCKINGAIVADNTTVGALSHDSDKDIYIMTYTDFSSEELAL